MMKNNIIYKLYPAGIIILMILSLLSCSSTAKRAQSPSVSEWDLRCIGFYENWDNALCQTGYSLGVIDMNSEVQSDDGTVSTCHSDLIFATVRKLSDICRVKMITLSDNASKDELQAAITSLINEGIRVINVSLGSSKPFELNDHIRDEIENKGVLIICSSGNNVNGLMYPALSEGTVSVLACDIYGNVSKNLDNIEKKSFTAPGLHVYILDNYFSGSSVATVYVSVICAAYQSLHPDLNKNEIAEKLSKACLESSEYSYGIPQINQLF